MKISRSLFLRVAVMAVALAAVAVLMGRDEAPAQATSFTPSNSVSLSDPTPGAHSDITIDFSLDEPDSFPNITNNPAIQFIPKQWKIHTPETDEEALARLGGVAGTFNTVTKVGLLGAQCNAEIPVNFTMIESTPDTGFNEDTGAVDPEKLTSSLDLGSKEFPPLGAGFSGQFVDDPNFADLPSDFGTPLIDFNADEKYNGTFGFFDAFRSSVYRDVDGNDRVTAGDIRLHISAEFAEDHPEIVVGSVVEDGDPDELSIDTPQRLSRLRSTWSLFGRVVRHAENVAENGQMDPGEHVYWDNGSSGDVSDGDDRAFEFEGQPPPTRIKTFALPGGVTRYPDFLNEMFPPSEIGDPLARLFGQSRVDFNPVSLNLVTYAPGQLPGFPPSLGYPTVVVVLNPLQLGQDPAFLSITAALCTPLALSSTNFGISQDNPGTPSVDEGGFARLTNPRSEKDHAFTLVVESQADADDDGIESLMDTCPADPNVNDLDGRGLPLAQSFANPNDPDGNSVDAACDTLEVPPADWDTPLVPFNADEKHTDFRFGTSSGIYRDNDGSGRVSAGDDRLYHPNLDLAPGVVQDTDSDVGGRLRNFTAPTGGGAPKHAENVAANGLYDPGENVYRDADSSGHVGFTTRDAQSDERLLFEGSAIGINVAPLRVQYIGTGGVDPSGFLSAEDMDQDNYVNVGDNCPVVPNGVEVLDLERIALRAVDFAVITRGDLIGTSDQTDSDGDGIGDACEGAEHGNAQCANDVDDDGDGVVNDGCPTDPFPGEPIFFPWGFGESVPAGGDFGWCEDDIDNDGDGVVNDGCIGFPTIRDPEGGLECGNAADDDGDGRIDDGCPTVHPGGIPESGADCDNALDDDDDDLVNDGCPTVDAAGEKFEVNGHVHQLTLERTVTIAAHGVKLDDLSGKQKVSSGGSAQYTVSVENKEADASQDAPTGLRVVEGCASVNGGGSQDSTTLSLAADGSGQAQFTVDWSGCPDGEYTVQADACHLGDPAPAGLFGSGACPGSDPHTQLVHGVHAASGATASSEAFGPSFGAVKAIDGNPSTAWCTIPSPGEWIQISFPAPVAVDQVDVENDVFGGGFAWGSGTLSFSNGYSQAVGLSGGEGSFEIVPAQENVEWVRFTGDNPLSGVGACVSELKAFGSVLQQLTDSDPLDDAPRSMTVTVGSP